MPLRDYDYDPPRWLITVSLRPKGGNRKEWVRTLIIETEPSLWWRDNKWQDKDESFLSCAILMVHHIRIRNK